MVITLDLIDEVALECWERAYAKNVVRRFFDAWNVGDTAAFEGLVDGEFEEPWAPSPGYGKGPDGARASYASAMTRYSELHFELEDLVAEPAAVACRTVLRFTERQTGVQGRMVGMNIFHLSASKLVREWYVYIRVG